ncbi:hypothetical protein [Ureibacillus acetophenoni]|uniref:SnoaL-like protein n=1 Tax=Ureibacillus acetophenoni TaxID=614649 RepID=A0A285UL42_9BACL|nr:hypothetical protein [Ureibacillus acetophenoni]SOC42634.1 hypothetical protein SAMN05877842_11368 [Ureibacillus acetophenoni]
MLDTENKLNEFRMMHDEFIKDWNKAMQSGDTSTVERMADEYYVAFFNGSNEKPLYFTRQEAIEGMKQSVNHFLGATKRFENRVIRLRNNENAVVFYEQLIVKNEVVLARLFTIENWSWQNEKWLVVREIEQPIN